MLWRGSLLPLGCEAPPKTASASQPSGSKLPRHKGGFLQAVVLFPCTGFSHEFCCCVQQGLAIRCAAALAP
ncbi:hypothetical protein B4O85_25105 [Pseudomonas azotoformans]|uniref:Uncharacterized protein n=1 Tax=Pseudomonas azotoformans TaxID=47878 RepID=A0A4Q0HME4_PSEAZ|nr:hypothetical protein B4O85_25105 [Pseudomonas azotoformans]